MSFIASAEKSSGSVWSNFVNLIGNPWMIAAIVLVAIGIALVGIAKPLAKVVKKTDTISNNEPVKITTTLVGVACIIAGFIAILVLTITINTGV